MSNAYIYCMYGLMFLPHEKVYEKSIDVCLIELYVCVCVCEYQMLSLFIS
jgi:hypothetical protein